MKIPRPSQADQDYFCSLLPAAPDVEVKPMFGNLGAFVNGNMFCGLFGDSVGVRLTDAADRDELAAAGGGPFGPSERPMRAYLSLPASWRDGTGRIPARDWVTRAYRQVRALPAKSPARESASVARRSQP